MIVNCQTLKKAPLNKISKDKSIASHAIIKYTRKGCIKCFTVKNLKQTFRYLKPLRSIFAA